MTDQDISADDVRQLPAWIPTVGPGWTALLNQLHRDLLALDPSYRIEHFGTALGGLRIAVADRFDGHGEFDGEFADRAATLTDAAETASEHTCEICGSPGRLRFRGDSHGTWLTTVCDRCRLAPAAVARA